MSQPKVVRVRVTTGGDTSAGSSDTGKTLSLTPPLAWRFIDGNLGCAINRGDIKWVWLSQGPSFTTQRVHSLCLTEILRHFSSSSHKLIKCSPEKGSDLRDPSLCSTAPGAEIRHKYLPENPASTPHGELPGHHHYLTGLTAFPSTAFLRKPETATQASPSIKASLVSEDLASVPQDKPCCIRAMTALNLGEPLLRRPLSVVWSSEVKLVVSSWSHWLQRAVLSCKCFPSASWTHLGLQHFPPVIK